SADVCSADLERKISNGHAEGGGLAELHGLSADGRARGDCGTRRSAECVATDGRVGRATGLMKGCGITDGRVEASGVVRERIMPHGCVARAGLVLAESASTVGRVVEAAEVESERTSTGGPGVESRRCFY